MLQAPVFQDLRGSDIDALLPDLHERRFAGGQEIWREGDRADALYVIAQGQLKSYRVSQDGREVIVGVHPAVSVTGEVGVFHPRRVRWLNLAAMTPTTCLTIARPALLSFLSQHPVAMGRMLEQLAIAAVQAAYSFSGLALDDIGRRVATRLVSLAGEQADHTDRGLRIRARLSQGELAAHVGASRESVNRALATLVSRGVVSQQDGHFYIHDLPALERAATADRDFS